MAFRNRKLSAETKLRISKANKLVIMAVVVLMLGSFSSSCSYVSAAPLQSANQHHKVSDKKQDSGSDSNHGGGSSDNSDGSTSRSDKTLGHTDDRGSSASHTPRSNNLGNSDNNKNKNNDQGTNDVGNTGKNQGNGENVPLTRTDTPTSQPTCEQGSNCTDHQSSTDSDRSTTATAAIKQDDNTPFVLSLPFPLNNSCLDRWLEMLTV